MDFFPVTGRESDKKFSVLGNEKDRIFLSTPRRHWVHFEDTICVFFSNYLIFFLAFYKLSTCWSSSRGLGGKWEWRNKTRLSQKRLHGSLDTYCQCNGKFSVPVREKYGISVRIFKYLARQLSWEPTKLTHIFTR